jgi:thiol-disulfide isomerase/thioredoxin
MEKDERPDVAGWTDERLARLAPDLEWEPSVSRLTIIRQRLVSDQRRRRARAWLAASATALVVMAFGIPTTRALAHSCAEFIARNLPGSGANRAVALPERFELPDFTLDDASGRSVTLSTFRGKVVLLTFWTTSCGQCETEARWFNEFQRRFGEDNFVVLGLALDHDGWSAVRPYLEREGHNYRVMVASRDDPRLRPGPSIPTTLIIDRSGCVAVRHVGFCSKQEYERDIQQVLAERRTRQ